MIRSPQKTTSKLAITNNKENSNKCIKAYTSTIWQHILHIPPTKILISYPLKKTNKQKPHKRAYLSENGDLGETKSGE